VKTVTYFTLHEVLMYYLHPCFRGRGAK